jgi:hypothetical protein
VDGGEGFDTVVIVGRSSQFKLVFDGGVTYIDALSGASAMTERAQLNNVEQVQFLDKTVSLVVNDTIKGSPGIDFFDGGLGLDTVVYSGPQERYTINKTGNRYVVSEPTGSDDTDYLSNIERLQFANGKVALDVENGNAGEAAKLIADPQVRNRGTIGGDIAHGDPGNDHPALSIAIDASFVLEGPNGRRTVAANGFFLGTYMTQLEENEVMCEIRVPAFAAGTGYAYEKLKRKTGDWATAGCAVVIRKNGDQVSHVRIALTNVAPTALHAEAAEAALLNKPFNAANVQAAVAAAIAICDPAEDLRGDIEYKTAMAGEMVKRALNKAWALCA